MNWCIGVLLIPFLQDYHLFCVIHGILSDQWKSLIFGILRCHWIQKCRKRRKWYDDLATFRMGCENQSCLSSVADSFFGYRSGWSADICDAWLIVRTLNVLYSNWYKRDIIEFTVPSEEWLKEYSRCMSETFPDVFTIHIHAVLSNGVFKYSFQASCC